MTKREKKLAMIKSKIETSDFDSDAKRIMFILSEELTKEMEINKNLAKALNHSLESHGHSANEVSKIRDIAFPGVEFCDCETPCSCGYPPGFVELTDLFYHCEGSRIGDKEALASYEKSCTEGN